MLQCDNFQKQGNFVKFLLNIMCNIFEEIGRIPEFFKQFEFHRHVDISLFTIVNDM